MTRLRFGMAWLRPRVRSQLDVLGSTGQVVASQSLGPQPVGASSATWDGRLADGSWAPEGRYLLRVTASDPAGSHVAPMDSVDADALMTWGVVASLSPPGATYVPLSPSRLLDTRVGNGLSGPFTMGVPRTCPGQRAGWGAPHRDRGDRHPDRHPAERGRLRVPGPRPGRSPTSSTLNFPPADNRATGVTVALSPTGSLSATYMSRQPRAAPSSCST